MKNQVIRARIDAGLKARASEVLDALGFEMSDAIRLFLEQVARKGKLPFAVREPSVRRVSGKRLWQMKRRSQKHDRAMMDRAQMPAEAMLFVRPHHFEGARLEWPKVSLGDD